jgi:uncharacterized membrane protein YdbT with pleckstrin-like domain
MQQMQEPERSVYDQGYQDNSGYPAYKDKQFSQEYSQDEEQQGYRINEREQQKLQPVSGMERGQRAMAIGLVAVTSPMLGFAIAVFVLSAVNLANALDILPFKEMFERLQASFALSLILLILTIVAFVFAIVNLALSERKYRRRGRRYTTTSF